MGFLLYPYDAGPPAKSTRREIFRRLRPRAGGRRSGPSGHREAPRLAVAHDATGRRMMEVRAQDEGAGLGMALAEGAARLARRLDVAVEVAARLGLGDLDGMVHEVAGDDGGAVAGVNAHAGVAGRVAGGRLEPDLAGDPVVHGHEVGESGIQHR